MYYTPHVFFCILFCIFGFFEILFSIFFFAFQIWKFLFGFFAYFLKFFKNFSNISKYFYVFFLIIFKKIGKKDVLFFLHLFLFLHVCLLLHKVWGRTCIFCFFCISALFLLNFAKSMMQKKKAWGVYMQINKVKNCRSWGSSRRGGSLLSVFGVGP